jgi:hypothetical protein
VARVEGLQAGKRVGVAFFNAEFENMFICCLDVIAERFPEYGWNLDRWDIEQDHESVVGAKGYISRHMQKGKVYKETRDQVKFLEGLDYERLRARSRSFKLLEGLLRWLANDGEHSVYPVMRR